MRGLIQQPPRSRDRHMIWRCFLQSIVQESPQTQAVGHSPADTAFALDSFEESDQQQPEVHTRSQRRPPYFPVIELTTSLLAKRVEARFVQNAVQPLVKGMSRRLRPLACVEQLFLLLPNSPRSHRHACFYAQTILF